MRRPTWLSSPRSWRSSARPARLRPCCAEPRPRRGDHLRRARRPRARARDLAGGLRDHPLRRYPVVYFLHGLPSGASAYRGNDWLADALRSAGPAILVIPQGARDNDTDPEYLDWGVGRNWKTYVAPEVPHYVDAHFRTIATLRPCDRRPLGRRLRRHRHRAPPPGTLLGDRVVVGLLPPDRSDGDEAARPRAAAIAHRLVGVLRGEPDRLLAFYVGRATCDSATRTSRFDRELTAAHVPHLFELYRGAHTELALAAATPRAGCASRSRHLARPTAERNARLTGRHDSSGSPEYKRVTHDLRPAPAGRAGSPALPSPRSSPSGPRHVPLPRQLLAVPRVRAAARRRVREGARHATARSTSRARRSAAAASRSTSTSRPATPRIPAAATRCSTSCTACRAGRERSSRPSARASSRTSSSRGTARGR